MPTLILINNDPAGDAVKAANSWVEAAKPVIKAWLAVDHINAELNQLSYHAQLNRSDYGRRVADEGVGYLTEAMRNLHGMLAGIRDDFISGVTLAGPADDDGSVTFQQQWDYVDEFNGRLERETINVGDAIRLCGDY